MRRDYIYYILFVFLFFLSIFIIFPTRWVNIDVGSFHYHKLWQKITLDDLTNGNYSNDFHINWGRDIVGGKKYKISVQFESEENTAQEIDQTIDLFSKRLSSAGYSESNVWYEKVNEDYVIFAEVSGGETSSYEFESTILQKGKFVIWGQKDEEDVPAEGSDEELTSIDAILERSYENFGLGTMKFRGFRVEEEDGQYVLVLGLDTEASKIFTEKVQLFYGKMILAQLDENILSIDGGSLGEQLSQRGKIISINIPGFASREQAELVGSVIYHAPLETNLSISETTFLESPVDLTFIRKGTIGALLLSLVIAACCVVAFRKNGILASILIFVYEYLFVILLKVFPITFTFGSLLSLILMFGFFVGSLLLLLRSASQQQKQWVLFTKHQDTLAQLHSIQSFVILLAGLSAILLLIMPWLAKTFLAVLFIGCILFIVSYEIVLPISFSLVQLLKKENE